jgi:hypothetical protein
MLESHTVSILHRRVQDAVAVSDKGDAAGTRHAGQAWNRRKLPIGGRGPDPMDYCQASPQCGSV